MLHIWAITDNRIGHRTQLEGLLDALGELSKVEIQWHDFGQGRWGSWRSMVRQIYLAYRSGSQPDLVLAAGHAAHTPLLITSRLLDAKSIVLMTPSLPVRFFDLVIAPRHDGLTEGPGVINTQGAISRVKWSDKHDHGKGLILIGGPSRHHGWDSELLVGQINQLMSVPEVEWELSTSPRTPLSFIQELKNKCAHEHLAIYSYKELDPEWLPERLGVTGQVWVSEDSVSMIYDALSAGAAVGVFEVPRLGSSRIIDGLHALIDDGYVVPFSSYDAQQRLSAAKTRFSEAERCAKKIMAWVLSEQQKKH